MLCSWFAWTPSVLTLNLVKATRVAVVALGTLGFGRGEGFHRVIALCGAQQPTTGTRSLLTLLLLIRPICLCSPLSSHVDYFSRAQLYTRERLHNLCCGSSAVGTRNFNPLRPKNDQHQICRKKRFLRDPFLPEKNQDLTSVVARRRSRRIRGQHIAQW